MTLSESQVLSFRTAIESGNIVLFDELLAACKELEQKDRNAIFEQVIVHSPGTALIKHFLETPQDGCKPSYTRDGMTVLHLAAISDYTETVRFFLEKGLDVNAPDNEGATPLLKAAQYSVNPGVIQALIDAGADIQAADKNGETALIKAASYNPNPEITRFFLEQGLDIEACDNEGFTPILCAAAHQSNPEIIDLLLQAGANLHAKTHEGMTINHAASFNENVAVARYVCNSFSVFDTDNDGWTALQTALARAKSAGVLKLYLRRLQEEILTYASLNSTPEILQALIEAGFNANTTTSDGTTVLMHAAELNSNPDIIKMLRSYNAIWNNSDAKGRTALHRAAANPNPAIYNWMIEDNDFKTLADRTDSAGNRAEYYLTHKDEF